MNEVVQMEESDIDKSTGRRRLSWYLLFWLVSYAIIHLVLFFIIYVMDSDFSFLSVPSVMLPLLFTFIIIVAEWRSAAVLNRSRPFIVAVALLCVLISAVPMYRLSMNEYYSWFTVSKWEQLPMKRHIMMDSLLKKHKLVGMERDEVEALLGEGEESTEIGETGAITTTYLIGSVMIDPVFLDIEYHSNRIVSAYHIRHHE